MATKVGKASARPGINKPETSAVVLSSVSWAQSAWWLGLPLRQSRLTWFSINWEICQGRRLVGDYSQKEKLRGPQAFVSLPSKDMQLLNLEIKALLFHLLFLSGHRYSHVW